MAVRAINAILPGQLWSRQGLVGSHDKNEEEAHPGRQHTWFLSFKTLIFNARISTCRRPETNVSSPTPAAEVAALQFRCVAASARHRLSPLSSVRRATN